MKKVALFGFTALCGALLAAPEAQAVPYAYASNQITGLIITYADGTRITPASANEGVSDSAFYTGYGSSGTGGSGPVGTAIDINQAYNGPGSAPAENTWNPAGGGYVGARADANIGAGSAIAGGVAVNNVAEAYGYTFATSTGTNNATIVFKVLGTGQAVKLTFTDTYSLNTSTQGNPAEYANAVINNSFSVTAFGSSTPLSSYAPTDINQNLSSLQGVPPNALVSGVFDGNFTSAVLQEGVLYNIALNSGATVTINAAPEPASLALIGTGLVGLGMAARRRRRG